LTPELAKKINVDFTGFVQETLEAYVNEQIQSIYKLMETQDHEQILKSQGAIMALRSVLRAKGYAKDVLNLKEK
jgi:hypothetical protein